MRTIYKYPLKVEDEQPLTLRGRILSAGVQDRDIMVWAIHDDSVTPRTVRVSVRGTGHPLHDADQGEFIDTVFLGPLVFHVFAKEV